MLDNLIKRDELVSQMNEITEMGYKVGMRQYRDEIAKLIFPVFIKDDWGDRGVRYIDKEVAATLACDYAEALVNEIKARNKKTKDDVVEP